MIGKLVPVCTSATRSGGAPIETIVQDAATAWIMLPNADTRFADHSIRNSRVTSGSRPRRPAAVGFSLRVGRGFVQLNQSLGS